GLIDTVQARLAKATAQEKAYWEEQLRELRAYQAEMQNYAPELPDITLTKSHVIKDRAHDLHIEFSGRAHTAGDVVVFCPQKRAVATGDAIIGYVPNSNDGYPRDWPRTIDSIEKMGANRILTGHGPVLEGNARPTQLRNYIQELVGIIE